MFKRRSAFAKFSSQRPAISGPTDFIKRSSMGDLEKAHPPGLDSVTVDTSDDVDAGTEHETNGELAQEDLYMRLDSLHTPIHQSPPLRASTVASHPLKSHPIPTSSKENSAPPPPDFSRRGIHIPTRTSSNGKAVPRRPATRSSSNPILSTRSQSSPRTPRSFSAARSSADSLASHEETTSPAVVTRGLGISEHKALSPDSDRLSPLLEDDPTSFDLVAPESGLRKHEVSLEARVEKLFSSEHLEAIFQDTASLLRFTSFLSHDRPKSVPILVYYLDALKAIRAINYANAVAEALEPLEGLEFTQHPPRPTVNAVLEEKARQAFDVLVRDELPAFITHVLSQVVSFNVQKRITGDLSPMLGNTSEGLAEVFCLSDPSRKDNPIIFATEEFHRTTQYGVSYSLGRNCRFLQGPQTNPNSVARLHRAVNEGKEISELILNYRRDGSPFMNLLMIAPLHDSRGTLRYFMGAQVDVTALVEAGTNLDAFKRMMKEARSPEKDEPKEEFKELSQMFNNAELNTIDRFGGSMHRELPENPDAGLHHRGKVVDRDPSDPHVVKANTSSPMADSRLSAVYKYYLIVRPAPSLRILFTSPSLRLPGITQSRLLDRIGGSPRVRNSLAEALTDGTRGVTAKIRWLSLAASKPTHERIDEGRPRWIHCTPLLSAAGAVGVWMVILIDDEKSGGPVGIGKFRPAPPIAPTNGIHVSKRNGSASSNGTGIEEKHVIANRVLGVQSQDKQEKRRSLPVMAMRNPGLLGSISIERPQSAVSERRGARVGSPETGTGTGTGTSVYSFALS